MTYHSPPRHSTPARAARAGDPGTPPQHARRVPGTPALALGSMAEAYVSEHRNLCAPEQYSDCQRPTLHGTEPCIFKRVQNPRAHPFLNDGTQLVRNQQFDITRSVANFIANPGLIGQMSEWIQPQAGTGQPRQLWCFYTGLVFSVSKNSIARTRERRILRAKRRRSG